MPFCKSLAVFLAAGLMVLGRGAAADRPPNILLIMADDVGVETLGCYGGESYKTPHIDALARSGVRFNGCYSMPVCHPTRTTLLTGKYPFRLGHPRWGSFPKSEENHTLPNLLKTAGYATAIAGKWQLVLQQDDPLHPRRLGFEQSCLFGWHEGPRYYDPLIWQNGKRRRDTKGRYGPDLYVAFLVDFMSKNRRRPFFAFYSMALCHDVTDDLKQPVPFGPQGRYDTYAEMIAQMDRHVGQIVAAVDKLGLGRQTVILFTGDNGTSRSYIHTAINGKYVRKPVFSRIRGKPVRGGKGELTDDGTHVPLLVRWSGVIPPGQVVEDLVDFSDYLPTCVDLAGKTLPQGFATDGVSFARRLRGKGAAPRQWAYSERGAQRYWLRSARWKLYNSGEFFDLKTDPLEKKPLPTGKLSPDAAQARQQLQQALRSLRR